MKHCLSLMMLTGLLVVCVTGCRSNSLYVNVPPQTGDVASHNPNQAQVRAAMSAAIAATLEVRPLEGPVLLRLPDGCSNLTYADVARRGGRELVTPFDEVVTVAELEVTGVRLRGNKGYVDIVRPGRGGQPELVIAEIKRAPMDGWYVHYMDGSPVREGTVYYPLQVQDDEPVEQVPVEVQD